MKNIPIGSLVSYLGDSKTFVVSEHIFDNYYLLIPTIDPEHKIVINKRYASRMLIILSEPEK